MTFPLYDVSIPTQVLPLCVGMADGDTIDQISDATDAAFDGSELCAPLYAMTAALGAQGIIMQCARPISVLQALTHRGAVMATRSGRVGVSIGYGRVVEPCGRQYVLTIPDPSRYLAAYDTGHVAYTMGSPM